MYQSESALGRTQRRGISGAIRCMTHPLCQNIHIIIYSSMAWRRWLHLCHTARRRYITHTATRWYVTHTQAEVMGMTLSLTQQATRSTSSADLKAKAETGTGQQYEWQHLPNWLIQLANPTLLILIGNWPGHVPKTGQQYGPSLTGLAVPGFG